MSQFQKVSFLTLFLLLSACEKPTAPAQKNQLPEFEKSFSITERYESENQTLYIDVSLKEGYHAYAKGEKIGVPVALNISKTRGWELLGEVEVPLGFEKDLGSLGISILLEDNFTLTAKVGKGKGPIDGTLKMQVCTDNACDRPRNHHFSVKTSQSS